MKHLVFLLLFLGGGRVLWAELREPEEVGRIIVCVVAGAETIHRDDRLHVTVEPNIHQIAVGGDQHRVLFKAQVDYGRPVRWSVDVDSWPDHYAGRHAGHLFTGFRTHDGGTRLEEWTLDGAIGTRWTRCPKVAPGERARVTEVRVDLEQEPSLTREHLVTLPFPVQDMAVDFGGRYLLLLTPERGGLFVLDLASQLLRPVPLEGRLAFVLENAWGISREHDRSDTFVLWGDLTHEVELRDRGGDGRFERVRIVDTRDEPTFTEWLLSYF